MSRPTPWKIIAWTAVFAALWATTLYNFLLFHTLAELFSIVIAGFIFVIAWNSRRYLDNGYLLFVGVAYVFVALLDTVHTLAYKGMGVFPGYGANLPTQLWIATRYLEAISLLLAPLFLRQKPHPAIWLLIYGLVTGLLLLSIFAWGIFPNCFVEGEGLTWFKKGSEYAICLILVGAGVFLWSRRALFSQRVYHLLLWSLGFTILAEIAFTFYVSVYGISNMLGHFAKIFSFYLIYLALLRTGVTKPQEVIFSQLKDSEERYRNIVEAAGEGIVILDEDERITFANQRMANMLRTEIKELLGREMSTWIHPQEQEDQKRIASARRQGIKQRFDRRLVRRDGTAIWTQVSCTPLLDRDDKYLGAQAMFTDVTERKQAEDASKEQAAELGAIYESAPIILMLVDQDRRVLRINGFGQKFAGVSEEEVIGLRGGEALRCLNALDDQEGCGFGPQCGQCVVRRTVLDTLETGRSHNLVEASLPFLVDGERKELAFLISTSRLTVGSESRALVSIMDITERKQAEEALRASEEKFSKAFKNSPTWLTITTLEEGRYLEVNDTFLQDTGYSRQEVIGYTSEDLGIRRDTQERKRHVELLHQKGSVRNMEVKRRLKSGEERTMLYSGTSMEMGGETLLLSQLEDITEQREAEQALAHSEAFYRHLFEKAGDAIYLMEAEGDEAGTILIANQAAADMHGSTAEEFTGKKAWEKAVPEIQAQSSEHLRRIAQGEWLSFESEHFHQDGHTFPVAVSVGAVVLAGKKYLLAFERDISEQRQAEDDARRSQEKYATLYKASPAWLVVSTLGEGRFVEVNDAFCQAMGYSREELVGRTSEELGMWVELKRRQEYKLLMERDGHVRDFSVRFRQKNGEIRDFLWSAESIELDGEPCAMSVLLDVTETKRAHEDLEKSEAQYRNLFDNIHDLVCVHDLEGRLINVNPIATTVLGYDRKEFLSLKLPDLIPEKHKSDFYDRYMKAIMNGGYAEGTMQMIAKDGEIHFIEFRNRLIEPEGEGEPYVAGLARDITERIRTASALKESEDLFRSIFENSRDAIFITGPDARFVRVNQAAVELTGYSRKELLAMTVGDLGADTDLEAYLRYFDKIMAGETVVGQAELKPKSGPAIPIEFVNTSITLQGKPYMHSTARDISERLRLEMQNRQAQKMEAVGTLAGGIAHDFNNVLSAVMGYIELTLLEVSPKGEPSEYLQNALASCRRAQMLVKQILSFSRQNKAQMKPLALAPLLKEDLKLLRATIPTTVEIKINEPLAAGIVNADPVQLHQVLLNLCTNAAQAMEVTGGELSVGLQKVTIEGKRSERYVDLVPGEYLRLEIEDTGPGIPPENLSRLFDPFFTTKEEGKGSGMGLAVVHGIVRQHAGTVTVYSQPGQGTIFHIYLPLSREKGVVDSKTASGKEIDALPGGNERIMIVDDEPAIAEVTSTILKRLGYEVRAFQSPQEAKAAFAEDPSAFDLVLTDFTMPKMTGAQLAVELLSQRPDLPIIIASGFTSQMDDEMAKKLGIRRFILKPLDRKALAVAVREVLDEKLENATTES